VTRSKRREFIKTTALAGGGLLLTDVTLRPGLVLGQTPPVPLAIARWDETALEGIDLQAAATRLAETAIADLGGMERFVSHGDVVWIKPNIGWNRRPELAANTNPDVVGTLVRLCLEAGARTVKVGDHPCHPARQCYRSSGIASAVEQAGGQMIYLDRKRFRDVEIKGEYLASWPLYVEVIEADLVINVPVVKHHGLTACSLAMKNYMGVIGGNRGSWHQNMEACLPDITQYMAPRLTVMDAVRVLTDHGPQGGDPDDVEVRGVVAAGTDIVALDAFGATLLGHDPRSVSTIAAAEDRGLGTTDFRSLRPVERVLS
jgi:uncharacterized protein (DUF362 family)